MSVQQSPEMPAPSPRETTRESTDATREAQDVLDHIGDLAHSLVTAGQEHRAKKIWERFPILGNIRSHTLATKEAQIVHEMNAEIRHLEALVAQHQLPIDISALKKAAGKVGAPGGVTKLIATLAYPLRGLHRGVVGHRRENIHRVAQSLRGSLRRRPAAA
jgi:hypothetical protein